MISLVNLPRVRQKPILRKNTRRHTYQSPPAPSRAFTDPRLPLLLRRQNTEHSFPTPLRGWPTELTKKVKWNLKRKGKKKKKIRNLKAAQVSK
jgi:hypothetical protein